LPSIPTRPNVVFVLLDAVRADRFGGWGNPNPTTPNLDALARAGIRFARHYANSHATRASMPQLMSGRYYHPDVLRGFEPFSNPSEYPFRERDGSVLLPELLRQHGYEVLGVSAHPWVVGDCPLGQGFHRLDFLPAEPSRGHVDAASVVDRAIGLWRDRARDRPAFLYVHVMDLHIPRWLPNSEVLFLPPGVAWRERFTEGSIPRFGHRRRFWDPVDARDFTPADRAIFAAFYDTSLAYTDAQLARLLDVLRSEDADLLSSVVAIVADHGEDLGEEGRTSHSDSLTDGVQHIPFILAGAGLEGGQRVEAFSENVDVVPTLARLLNLETPLGAFDGRPLVEADAHRLSREDRPGVFYAWLEYQAVRTRTSLLRLDAEGAPEAVCRGRREVLWRLDGSARREVGLTGPAVREAEALRAALLQRLAGPEARFFETLRHAPTQSLFVPPRYWRVADGVPVTCHRIGADTRPGDLRVPGWHYARQGFFLSAGGCRDLEVTVATPDGPYEVDVGVVPLGRPPRLFKFHLWLRRAFRDAAPERFVPLGAHTARECRLTVAIPEAAVSGHRLVTLRLTPAGARAEAPPPDEEDEHHARLRALGYVE